MICYDPSHTRADPTPAAAVCAHCGAALCLDHVTECTREIVHHTGYSPPSVMEPAGRSMCCDTCKVAGTQGSHVQV